MPKNQPTVHLTLEGIYREVVNTTTVAVADLRRVAKKVGLLPVEQRTWEGRWSAMRNDWLDLPILERTARMQSIDFRLAALSELVQAGDLRGWVRPAGLSGSRDPDDAVWRAAAVEPVVWREPDGQPSFDRDSFLARVLKLAEAQGAA